MPELPLWVAVTHFLNLLLLTLLARSGIEVLSALPKLYLSDHCPPGREVARFSKKIKWIRAIELVESYAQIGMVQGGWREYQQYYANAAGI